MTRPYVELRRADWAGLAEAHALELDDETLARLRGLGDPTDLSDVVEVYRPLTQLLELRMACAASLHRESNRFLGLSTKKTPFVIGVAGSVAVGKSTTARLLAELIRRSPRGPSVELVTTDGFLLPNAELDARGLAMRKGFPESYDRRALLRFVAEVKSGAPEVRAPVYSHLTYDIVPGEELVIRSPDVLIVEGLNVLQPARIGPEPSLAVSDFFDFSVYVDADAAHIRRWFVERFMALRATAFLDPRSFFRQFALLDEAEALEMAGRVWDEINGPNLAENIAPTRGRATSVLRKGPNHELHEVWIRKV